MAEEDSKTENSKPQGKSEKQSMRQIRPGKDYAFVVNGQQVVLFDAPKKIRAKSEITLPGYHLSVYDRVYLRAKDSRFSPINLHRAYADTDPIIFSIPDFDKFLKEGDPVWVELISTKNPEASGYLFPYVTYSFKSEEEADDQDKSKKHKAKKDKESEEAKEGKGLGFAGLAVAAAGETITGLTGTNLGKNDQGGAATTVREKLKTALANRDRKALKEAIDEAKNSHDFEALQEAYKNATGSYEKALFEDALGNSDFTPKIAADEDVADIPEYQPGRDEPVLDQSSQFSPTGAGVAGLAEVAAGGTAAMGASTIGESHTGSGQVVSRGSTGPGAVIHSKTFSSQQAVGSLKVAESRKTVSGSAQAEASGGEVGAKTSVKGGTQAESSAKFQGEVVKSTDRSISGSSGGAEIQRQASVSSQTQTEQHTESNVGVKAGGTVTGTASTASEVAVNASLGATADTSGLRAEIKTITQSSPQRPAPAEVSASQASPAKTVKVGGKNSVSGSFSGTAAKYGYIPIGQGSTVRPGVQIQPGMPGVKIEASTLQKPLQSGLDAGQKSQPAALEEVQEPTEKDDLKAEKTVRIRQADVLEAEIGSEKDEARALAGVSPDAKQAVAKFIQKDVLRTTMGPGVALPKKNIPRVQNLVGEFVLGEPVVPDSGNKDEESRPELELRDLNIETARPKEQAGAPQQRGKVSGRKVPKGEPAQPYVPAVSSSGGLAVPDRSPKKESQPESSEAEPDTQARTTETENLTETDNKVKTQADSSPDQQAETEKQQEQEGFNKALSDRLDKLAEDKKLDAEIKKVTQEANLALDEALMEGVAWVWAAAIPSFGLAVLLGAIVGDFLWAFKNSLIEGVLKPLLRTEALRKKAEEIAKQIKISSKVKLNIVAMNLVVVAAIMLVLLALFLFVWVGCNYPPGLSKISYKLTVIGAVGGSSVCESLDKMTSNFSFGGGDSGGAGASGSWGSGGLLSTNQWTSQINQAAAQYSVDPCILRVVVQKESGGQANIIGCDCAANGKPELCPAGARGPYTPSYQFNWDQCSYGIGLTQWTIYQRSSSANWNRWENPSTPSRNVLGDKYYNVNDFLDPQTSLNLTARAFKNYLNQSGGSVAGAFRAYMGNGAPQSWVDQRMALYNMCKSSGGQ